MATLRRELLRGDKATAELYLASLEGQFVGAYESAVRALLQRLHDPGLSEAEYTRTRQLLAQLKNDVGELNASSSVAAKTAIAAALYYGVARATASLNVPFRLPRDVTALSRLLTNQIVSDTLTANATMLRNAMRYVNEAQQVALARGAVAQLSGAALVNETLGGTALFKSLQTALAEGKLLTINGRRYDPVAYAKTLMRTRMAEAHTQAVITTSVRLGNDLVQVSAQQHRGRDNICPQYAGRVYSIGGGSPAFPRLTVAPPFHIGCYHTLTPVRESALRKSGKFNALAKLSASDRPILNMDDFREAIENA